MIYSFLRLFAVPVMLAGYVLCQLLFKKNKAADIKTDILYVALIIVVYFMMYAWLSD